MNTENAVYVDPMFAKWLGEVKKEFRKRNLSFDDLSEQDLFSAFYGEGYEPSTLVDVVEYSMR